ncbi:ABC transporter substrate-binding protein [Vibrio ouci]|uniref:Oligopeptide ABC transporter substrate-binding protein OppA n=1 Tax=Vibrio ouci TaxID=2499078 RepID=A0A4Y8WC79_9VIBR|nr:ABC transporter substrate-binding protein [Vibrio ouci]TFH90175.1 oligopeptide ABC transporter substrate-binding protein OppA [Vibrio ouci]
MKLCITRNRKQSYQFYSIFIVCLSLLAGPRAIAADRLADIQTLIKGNGVEVASIDPHKVQGVAGSNVIRDVLEGLVIQDPLGNIKPGVASHWSTEDNKTYTFYLRPDAKWSNGTPVTAADFVFSFQRLVDPKTASPYAWFLELATVQNAKAIIAGEKAPDQLGVTALDERTLRVELDEATPHFVMMASHSSLVAVPKATVLKYDDKWIRPHNFVGNGAYTLLTWIINERIDLRRNPQYWDNDKTTINRVSILPIDDPVSEMNRFLAGEIDITSTVPLEHFQRLTEQYPESVSVQGLLCTNYMRFNALTSPFNDVRIRRAISYVIDRDVLTQKILKQGQRSSYNLTPNNVAGFKPSPPQYSTLSQEKRIELAKQYLKSAGYDINNPLSVRLLFPNSNNQKKLAVAIQSMLKKALGVNVILENQEWKTYLNSTNQGEFESSLIAWCGDYNEASTFTSLMESNNTAGGSHFKNQDYDKIAQMARQAVESEVRALHYQEMENFLADEMPIAPLYQSVQVQLVSPNVGGYSSDNPENNVYSKDLYMIEPEPIN